MGADSASPLLGNVQDEVAVQYYTALNTSLGRGVEVKLDAGDGKGKGVFTTRDYAQGDAVFIERPLAAVQHLDSKLEVSTCSNCLRAVGTVEQHIGGKICCLINELSEATEQDDLQQVQDKVDKIHAAVDSTFLEGLLSGAITLPLTNMVDMAQPVPCRAGCGNEYCSLECEVQAWESYHCLLCTVGTDDTAAASSSASKGKGKAAAARQQQQDSRSQGHVASGGSVRAGSGSSCGSSCYGSSSKKIKCVVHQVHGATVNRSALAKFLAHADESNDIFRVAAQVIASTIITADRLLQRQAQGEAAEDAEAQQAYNRAVHNAAAHTQQVLVPHQQQHHETKDKVAASDNQIAQTAYQLAVAAAAEAEPRTSVLVLLPGDLVSDQQPQQPQQPTGQGSSKHLTSECTQHSPHQQQLQHLAALQLAFLPFALGHKAAWWDIPLQEQQLSGLEGTVGRQAQSCDAGSTASSDAEALELSAQMHELAGESLALLRKAIKDDRFPQLFDIQLYGDLIGMFELNNLALNVPAPVARYKALLLHPAEAGVAAAEAAAALAEVTPLLEALGEAADEPAQGTGFYALQSCINHSCTPNAAADCLATGETVIRAVRHIPAGSEVLLSYIEEEGAGLQERRQLLRDYGFTCHCHRCTAEELAQQINHQKLLVMYSLR